MGENNPDSFYISSDFDPNLIPPKETPKYGQLMIRSMLPMTICCLNCRHYIKKK